MKKMSLIVLSVLCVVILLVNSLKPVMTNERYKTYKLPEKLSIEIIRETVDLDGNQLQSYSIRKTADLLRFSQRNNIADGKANCVGYAQLCAAIYNCGAKAHKISGYARPVVGYIEIGPLNICSIARSIAPRKWKNFVKDHDFVEFTIDKDIFYADASVYDVIGTDCKTSKH